jgi:hypothetical protein
MTAAKAAGALRNFTFIILSPYSFWLRQLILRRLPYVTFNLAL